MVAVNDSEIYVKEKGSEEDFLLLPEEWGNYKYVLNEETKEITEVIEGTFRQYPIRLAWAITIHKSQGLTFERAIIDARNSFAHGQTYVAWYWSLHCVRRLLLVTVWLITSQKRWNGINRETRAK